MLSAATGACQDEGMLDVDLPPETAGRGPRILGSFRACLGSVLEIPVGEVPQHDDDLPAAVAQWRTWLAGRGVGLVPIANAPRFQWPGYWIAVLDTTREFQEQAAVLMFGTPAGVVLSPQTSVLLGRAAADLPVGKGYVVAPFDPACSAGPAVPAQQRGRVEAVAIADRAEAPMQRVAAAQAIPGRGLEGDRYANQAGTFTPRSGHGAGYDLTLIEAEVLDELTLAGGHQLGYAEARRNLVTRGIDLNSLVGQRFKVGDVECIGRRLCEPCAHLERLTHAGVLRKLIHRGGLRADVLTPGRIAEGAAVERLDQDEANSPGEASGSAAPAHRTEDDLA
jgi:MOSC domain-containing protein YiiM